MNSPAAIFDGSYADYKHIKTRKVLQIIVEIPAERAKAFFDMFGVPTGADEIPVAIAKMNMNLADASTREDEGEAFPAGQVNTSAAKSKREMTLAERIGMICQNTNFCQFVVAELQGCDLWDEVPNFVRSYCGVKSRSDILYDTPEAEKWKTLYTEFEEWLRGQS